MTEYENFLARIVARKTNTTHKVNILNYYTSHAYLAVEYDNGDSDFDIITLHWSDAIEQQFIDKESGA